MGRRWWLSGECWAVVAAVRSAQVAPAAMQRPEAAGARPEVGEEAEVVRRADFAVDARVAAVVVVAAERLDVAVADGAVAWAQAS